MEFAPFDIARKIYTQDQLMLHVNGWKAKGFVTGFTNGCFDILHKGHIAYLQETKQHCSKLIVGVNSNESVRSLGKGKGRPVNDELDRAYVLAGLLFVDAVVIFNESTPYEIIHKIKPGCLFKGGDYNVDALTPNDHGYIVGSDIVRSYHGKVMTIPFVHGYSTTGILEKVSHK